MDHSDDKLFITRGTGTSPWCFPHEQYSKIVIFALYNVAHGYHPHPPPFTKVIGKLRQQLANEGKGKERAGMKKRKKEERRKKKEERKEERRKGKKGKQGRKEKEGKGQLGSRALELP